MQKLIASVLTIGSSAFIFAGFFDSLTNLSSRWTNSRAAVEARIVDNYTDSETLEFNKAGHDANIREIEKFVRMVQG